jgi:hypothetical protein
MYLSAACGYSTKHRAGIDHAESGSDDGFQDRLAHKGDGVWTRRFDARERDQLRHLGNRARAQRVRA